jgi:hypothetical protein
MSSMGEQLENAALSVTRAGSIKDRLTDAYRNHLAQVSVEELPETLRVQFRSCVDALTREHPLPGEEAVRATVRKMSNHEADEIAANLVRLYGAFIRETTVREVPLPNLVLSAVPASTAGAVRAKKGVPQVISLYAHEA